ncbi:hypothetical protein N7540_002560 [Penicillium herquei]|nr:hypothetical protein N7540_002560 [Penicillium herquei]
MTQYLTRQGSSASLLKGHPEAMRYSEEVRKAWYAGEITRPYEPNAWQKDEPLTRCQSLLRYFKAIKKVGRFDSSLAREHIVCKGMDLVRKLASRNQMYQHVALVVSWLVPMAVYI